jgi:hypothetical protein
MKRYHEIHVGAPVTLAIRQWEETQFRVAVLPELPGDGGGDRRDDGQGVRDLRCFRLFKKLMQTKDDSDQNHATASSEFGMVRMERDGGKL